MRNWTLARLQRKLKHAAGAFSVYRDPFPRFLDYLGLLRPGRTRRIRLRNGITLVVRTGTDDFGVIDDIFLFRVYERALARIRPGDVVVDIGAQTGGFALAAAARGAQVLCFEPLKENLALLEQNARLNGHADRICGYNAAIAEVPGEMELCVVGTSTGGATFFPSIHPEWKERAGMLRVTVPCVAFADIVSRHSLAVCDVVKMDCEGAEFGIIEHAGSEDLRRIRALVMEYHPNGDIRLVRQRLESLGFSVDVSDHPCILYATQTRP